MSRNPSPDIFDRLVSLRLPAELEDRLRELAAKQGLTQSELHRRALHAFMHQAGIAGFEADDEESRARSTIGPSFTPTELKTWQK